MRYNVTMTDSKKYAIGRVIIITGCNERIILLNGKNVAEKKSLNEQYPVRCHRTVSGQIGRTYSISDFRLRPALVPLLRLYTTNRKVLCVGVYKNDTNKSGLGQGLRI